jgi:transitional endoplasmic reticulum ATPase
MDGIEELKGVVVLGATNRLDMVDPALLSPGRFDLVVDLPVPDRDTRRAIFAVHTRGKPLASDVDLNTLAEFSEGLMGGDIASICRRATMHAIRDHVEQQGGEQSGVVLSVHHFRHAIEAVMKASQYARAPRFLRELPVAERAPGEQQQLLSEVKPVPERTSPRA